MSGVSKTSVGTEMIVEISKSAQRDFKTLALTSHDIVSLCDAIAKRPVAPGDAENGSLRIRRINGYDVIFTLTVETP